jgi:hypothetical protein
VGTVYSRLIGFALRECHLALLVVRPEMGLSARGVQVVAKLKPFIYHVADVDRWPGTQLFECTASVHHLKFNQESLFVLQEFSTRLYQWIQPDLPEDLCLLRGPDEPWLVSITHENDSYLILSDPELAALTAEIPDVTDMLIKDDET